MDSGPSDEKQSTRRRRSGAAEEGVSASEWRRVHPVTPVLNSWQALAALLAVVVFQNFEVLGQLRELAELGNLVTVLLILLGLLVAFLLLVGLYSYLAWRAMSFAVTDEAVWLREGVLFRKQRHVRLERIQAVDVTHPLLGRIFGLGRLTVEAAGGAGSSLVVGYLRDAPLWDLRAEILARAAGLKVDAPPVQQRAGADGGVYAADSQHAGEGAQRTEAPRIQSRSLEAPEEVAYSVGAKTLILSLLLSGGVVVSFLLVLAVVVALIILAVVEGPAAASIALPSLIPMALVFGTFIWTRFASEFNFQAAVSPDGIRVRRGLLERKSETIPPRRVHAVTVYQPFLWRRRGWYRVQISQASGGEPGNKESFSSQVLLPVGTEAQAAQALWLVISDLGVAQPGEFLAAALRGVGPSPYFTGVPKRARLFDPLTYKRKGIALTETVVVTRSGWLTRTASLAPYERIQSVVGSYGPLAARRRLEGVQAALVQGPVVVALNNLSVQDGESIRSELVARSRQKRTQEPPERWFARVSGSGLEGTDEQ